MSNLGVAFGFASFSCKEFWQNLYYTLCVRSVVVTVTVSRVYVMIGVIHVTEVYIKIVKNRVLRIIVVNVTTFCGKEK